jgi:hypothetical protein
MNPIAKDIPKAKETTLGLYVTAAEAYAMWQADPEHVCIIDVRTPEEHFFVGHPPPNMSASSTCAHPRSTSSSATRRWRGRFR